jgi:filamentous hemagglutinin family protein
MNRSYRLVWNEQSQRYVPAPEMARGRGKGGRRAARVLQAVTVGVGLGLLSAGGWALAPNALPSGGVVTAGQATIGAPTPVGAAVSLTINQASQRAVINWNSYNIGSSASVTYVQPSSSSVMLNRVVGNEASQIYGQLKANGQVFLVNANGVLFAPGAQVNVHGLVASTLNILDGDFMAGTLHFAGTAGAVSNAGSISTDAGGYVALLGGQVSNSGQISAQLGSVVLASGSAATLDFGGNGLLKVTLDAGALRALADNAGLIQADGGRVQMSAQTANSLISAVVNNTGMVQARGLVAQNGVIELSGDVLHQGGTLDVSGAQGGSVLLSGSSILQNGTIHADGSAGAGGQVSLQASQTLLQTEAAQISADGSTQGGSVVLNGGQAAYLSGHVEANGLQGGQVVASATQITLAGANFSADGSAAGANAGGSVLVGGNVGGSSTGAVGVSNATSTAINASSHLSALGAGGRIVTWADGDTRYSGAAVTGAGGLIEIGGKLALSVGGSANAGLGGQQRLVTTDIVIGAASTGTRYIPLVDPNPATGDRHGSGSVTEVGGGNLVVASPTDNFGGASAGAVYLYNGSTGALISALYGRTAGDRVGAGASGSNGVTRLANGNYVISSPGWSNAGQAQAGAVTWSSAATGLSGALSSANSLVGGALDALGSGGVTALANGHYVISSPNWNAQTGAVTWGNGLGGSTGTVTAANSLTGSQAGDRVGSGGTLALRNGNYVVDSADWGGGLGAVTWRNGSASEAGVVSAGNSLVGTLAGDRIGSGGLTALSNGNYVVSSPEWSNGAAVSAGAVTWGNGGTGVSGNVSAANSLVGSAALDQLGSGGVTALSNGNYVVSSPWWDGAAVNVGAVTWGNGSAGGLGVVSSANSLTGSVANDNVGSGGVTALSNGNYVVSSPLWDGAAVNVGAVTWGAGALGLSGVVSSANSLTGSSTNDSVGSGGVTALSNGHYVVASADWGGGLGAATWRDGTTSGAGVVGAANSLVGSTAADHVSSGGITALSNGHYVVSSPDWDGAAVNVGAVTWSNGNTGRSGAVRAADSLTGSSVNDRVGSGGVTALSNGDYVVSSPTWNNGTAVAAGAVTRGTGATGSVGTVSSANSLVGGTANDHLGSGGITALDNGSYVVSSPDASNAGKVKAGTVVLAAEADTGTLNQIDALAPAGTTLTLQASHDISVNTPVAADGALVFDAGNQLTLNAPVTSRAAGNAALVMVAHSAFTNQAGASALNTPNGHWQIWSADPAADTRGGLAYDFKQYNATYGSSAVQGSGNGVFYTLAPVLTPSLSGTAVKTYDGNTAAPQSGLTLAASGAVDGDSVTLTPTATNYASRNAGTGIDVTASGLSASATNGTATVYGYQLASTSAVAAGAGTINQAQLAVNGSVADNKVYDTTTTATLRTGGALSGVVGTDRVTLTQAASFVDPNVGVAKTVNIANTLSGVDAGNYTVVASHSAADITPRVLSVSGATAANKVYDGNNTAALSNNGVLVGVLGADQVTLGQQTGTFVDKNVGTGKRVDIVNTLNGSGAGNYTVAASSSAADITPLALNVTGSVAASRVYDTTRTATLSSGGVLNGVIGTDQVALTQSAQFADKNVGTAKPVSITNTLTGAGAGNYTVGDSSSAANITPLALSVNGTTAANKVYDGNTVAALSNNGVLAGVLGADQVSLSSQTGAFADKNVGTAKPVSITNVLGGVDAGNYSVGTSTTNANITPLTLTVTGATAANKVYDGGTTATLSTPGVLGGAVSGDRVALLQTATFVDKNVGVAKPVGISNTLSGADAANYTVAGGSSSADITPRALSVTGGVAASKVYDGSTAATLSSAGSLSGLVSTDQVTLTQTAAFANKNVGNAKPVSINNAISGSDAANYALTNSQSSSSANITPLALSVNGTTAANKVYDGTTVAAVSTAGVLGGLISGDQVALSQTAAFTDKNVGVAKPVNIANTISGADAANYTVSVGQTAANITPQTVVVNGTVTANNKVYDGTTAATLTSNSTVSGVIGSDQMVLNQVGTFADKNVGVAKPVSISNQISGADAGNYLVSNPASLSAADITSRAVSVNGSVAANKVYDGGTVATLSSAGVLSGLVSNDQITLTQTAAFADKNVGNAKSVSIANGISGIDAGNYTLTNPSHVSSANITPLALTVNGTTAASKVYDSTTAATLTRSGTLAGVLGTDQVVLNGQTGTFIDKNVGTAKRVNIANSISGADVGNYTVNASSTTADITPLALNMTGSTTALSKVYDGTTVAGLNSNAALSGVLAGDQVALGQRGIFADHVVGTGKHVTVANSLNGADAGNYVVSQGSSRADITPLLGRSGVPIAVGLGAVADTVKRAVPMHIRRVDGELDLTIRQAAAEDVVLATQPPPSPPPTVPEIIQAPAPAPVIVAAAPPAPVQARVVVPIRSDVLFDFDKAILKPGAREEIDLRTGQLDNVHVVVIVGHTDGIGTDAYNDRLSLKRAEAVRAYFVSKHMDQKLIKVEGKGKRAPTDSNETIEGRAKNRRVEIEITPH